MKQVQEDKKGSELEGIHIAQRGFGAIAALPRVDRFCYFRRRLLALKMCWKPPPRKAAGTLETMAVQRIGKQIKNVRNNSSISKRKRKR